MSSQQDALLEILRQSSVFKSTNELRKALQERNGHPSSNKAVCRSMKRLLKHGLVERQEESDHPNSVERCYFWRIKDNSH
jgi:DNA-binding HxlR family transcriptional regulator